MKIYMTETTKGVTNDAGTDSMPYIKGKTYEMYLPWQRDLAHVFVDQMNVAIEVTAAPADTVIPRTGEEERSASAGSDGDEGRDGASDPGFADEEPGPPVGVKHFGNGRWYTVDAKSRKVDGPHNKSEAEVIRTSLTPPP